MPYSQKHQAKSRAFAEKLAMETVCVDCGAQPVEWHHVEPKNGRWNEVSFLIARGAPVARIETELARCVPVCRACHMLRDGRRSDKPCAACDGPVSDNRRRGMCESCYRKWLRSHPPETRDL